MTARTAFSAFALGAMLACNGDIAAVTWSPLDIDGIEDQMANPTAPLTDATVAELLATPADEIRLIQGLLEVGRLIVETSGEGDMEVMTRDLGVDLAGTQVFLRIACPGPTETAPDPDFTFGTLTVYSATLSEETIDTWGAQGDMFGVLDECIIGPYTLDGEMRMYYDVVRDLLGVEFAVDWSRSGASGSFTLPAIDERDALDDTDVHAQVLFTTMADGTLVVEQDVDLGLTEYRIRGADGEVVCDNTNDPPCPPI